LDPKKATLIYTSMGHAITHLIMLSLVIAGYFYSKENDVSATLVLSIIAGSGFAFGFGAILGGVLADRVGALNTLLLGYGLTLIGLLGLLFFDGIAVFALSYLIIGFGLSFYHPAGLTLVSLVFSKKRGKIFGFVGYIGSIGEASAFIMSAIVASIWGLDALYIVLIVCLLPFIPVGFLLPKLATLMDKRLKSGEFTSSIKTAASTLFLLLLAFMSMRGLFFEGTVKILPFFMDNEFGIDAVNLLPFDSFSELDDVAILIGIAGTILFIAGAPGKYLGGWMKDRYGARVPMLMFMLVTLFSLIGMLLSPNILLFMMCTAIFGFSFYGAQVVENTLIAEITPSNVRGSIYGLSFATRFGIGHLSLPLAGLLMQYDNDYGFVLMILFVSMALVILIPLWRRIEKN